MAENTTHIIADEGKVFRRIADGQIYGHEMYLGYTHYIGGVKLDTPHLDVPEDFEQVDAPPVPPEPEPEPEEITAEEALEIITGQ